MISADISQNLFELGESDQLVTYHILPSYKLGVLWHRPLTEVFTFETGLNYFALYQKRKADSRVGPPGASIGYYPPGDYVVEDVSSFHYLALPFGIRYDRRKWSLNIGGQAMYLMNYAQDIENLFLQGEEAGPAYYPRKVVKVTYPRFNVELYAGAEWKLGTKWGVRIDAYYDVFGVQPESDWRPELTKIRTTRAALGFNYYL